jgi:hypothetical protein
MGPWESVVRRAGRGMVVPASAARIGAGSGFVRCKIDAPHLHATFPQDKVRSAASGVKVGVRADLGFVRRACPRAFGRSFSLSRRACRRRRIGSESLTISSAYVQRVHATLGVRGSPGRAGNGRAGVGCAGTRFGFVRLRDRCERRCGLPPSLGFVRHSEGDRPVRCDRARVAREERNPVGARVRSAREIGSPGGMPCAARPWGSFGARARARAIRCDVATNASPR